jgi:antagonist of KipI
MRGSTGLRSSEGRMNSSRQAADSPSAMFEVLEPGPSTTVQDLGRYGYQRFGVPVSGALDAFSHRVANLLIGNPETCATLEITFVGPKLRAITDAIVAVTGADAPFLVNGEERPLWETVLVKRGDQLSFKPARAGVRSYLAVNGGIDVPLVMGSRSTCLGGKFGGMEGRRLVRGDALSKGHSTELRKFRRLPDEFKPKFQHEISLRAIVGPQDDYFSSSLDKFFNAQYIVTEKADRMGYRLFGPTLQFEENYRKSIISEPSIAGVVQIPPDGLPIIILSEQTVGGYAKIATVITADLGLVAQARPGDQVRFVRCDLSAARKAYIEYRKKMERIREVLGDDEHR